MPTGQKFTYTKEAMSTVSSMYIDGKSLSEIAATTKISHGTLYRILRMTKTPLRGGRPASPVKRAQKSRAKKHPESAPVLQAEPDQEPLTMEAVANNSSLRTKLRECQAKVRRLEAHIVKMVLEKG